MLGDDDPSRHPPARTRRIRPPDVWRRDGAHHAFLRHQLQCQGAARRSREAAHRDAVGSARRGCARRLRRDRQHRRAVRAVPSRAPRPHDRHGQPADREPAGDPAGAGRDGRRVRPPGRADLRGPDRHRHPVPVSIRRRGDRRGGLLGTVGHHRADRGRGRGAARGTRTNRARDRHRRRLEGRRRDADRRRTGETGSRPS